MASSNVYANVFGFMIWWIGLMIENLLLPVHICMYRVGIFICCWNQVARYLPLLWGRFPTEPFVTLNKTNQMHWLAWFRHAGKQESMLILTGSRDMFYLTPKVENPYEEIEKSLSECVLCGIMSALSQESRNNQCSPPFPFLLPRKWKCNSWLNAVQNAKSCKE